MQNPFELIDQRLDKIEAMLAELLAINTPTIERVLEENLSITELAKYLKCSKVTIHKYKKRKLFPFYGTGKMTYFKRSEVDAALRSQGKKKGLNFVAKLDVTNLDAIKKAKDEAEKRRNKSDKPDENT